MPILDFDTLVICNNDYNPNSLKETIRFFGGLGIRKIIITYGVDPAASSESYIINTYKQFKYDVRQAKTRGIDILLTYNVHLSDGCLKNPFMQKLNFNASNRIFLQAPLFIRDWWLMSDLNYLIYKQHLAPVLVATERNMISYDDKVFESFFLTQTAAFCIDINTITAPRYAKYIKIAILKNIPVIPCISNGLHSYVAAIERFKMLQDSLGTTKYLSLCKHINNSQKYILSI